MERKDAFQTLKETCKRACHERHACVDGYKQMLASTNVSQMMATWRNNWEDVVESKFADILCTELPKLYPALKQEMNQAGIYLNECPKKAPSFVLVLVTDCDHVVDINDYARCYVLGEATVRAWEHSQVYSDRCDQATIELNDHAYGHVSKGLVYANNASRLWTSTNTVLRGSVTCEAHGGSIQAFSYRKLDAYGDTKVHATSERNITLYGNVHIIV